MPANPLDDRRTVRRCSLAGFVCGIVLALLIVPIEFSYMCRRADGTVGMRGSTTFATIAKGPDGRYVPGGVAPPPDTSRPLYWYEKLAYGAPSAIPYLLFLTLIGYAVGRGRVRVRAALARPLTPEQTDYDDSISTNRPPVST